MQKGINGERYKCMNWENTYSLCILFPRYLENFLWRQILYKFIEEYICVCVGSRVVAQHKNVYTKMWCGTQNLCGRQKKICGRQKKYAVDKKNMR